MACFSSTLPTPFFFVSYVYFLRNNGTQVFFYLFAESFYCVIAHLVGKPKAGLHMLNNNGAVAVFDYWRAQHLEVFVFQSDLLVVLFGSEVERADGQIGFVPKLRKNGNRSKRSLKQKGKKEIPGKETKVLIFVDAKVSTSGDVSDPHGVQPIDESSSPFSASQFQAPQGPRLQDHVSSFVDDNAARYPKGYDGATIVSTF